MSGSTRIIKKLNFIKFKFTLVFTLPQFFFASFLFAQTPQEAALVSSFNVDPGLMGRTIRSQPEIPPETRVTVTRETEAVRASGIQPAEAKKVSFVLKGVRIKGNCVFSNQDLLQPFKPYINKKITLEDFIQTVDKITDKYHKAGFFLSKAIIPPQRIENGIVQVQVLEGFINEVKVEGDYGPNKKLLLQYGEALKAMRPIRLQELERIILLMNDIPGMVVKSVLAADPKVPLGSQITLLTQWTPVNFIGTYDNYQTLYLGPFETAGNVYFNSVFTPGGTTYLRALSSNTYRRLNYYELRHEQIFAPCGLVVGLDAFLTKTHPGFILEPLDIFGKSGDVNATLSYPWIRSRTRNVTLQAQFDIMNNESDALGEQLYIDKIRDLLLAFQINESFGNGTTFITASIDKGFNIFGADKDAIHSRLGSSPDFIKFNITGSRTQFLNDIFSFFILVTAQYSPRPLFAAEQMIFGGPYLGRGYNLAQFTGDQAIEGTMELRLNTTPNKNWLKQVQFYGFYDVGKLWSLIPNFPTIAESGASTGVGARAIVMPNFSFDAFLAKPLTTPNATDVLQGKSGKGWQKFFQITGTFNID